VAVSDAALDWLKAAGYDRDEDLVIARDQVRLDQHEIEMKRQQEILAEIRAKLEEAQERAVRVAASSRESKSTGTAYRKSWSRW
jgi:hypothetical protein